MATATKPPPATEAATTAEQVPEFEQVLAETERRRLGVLKTAAAKMGVEPRKLFPLLRHVWKASDGQPELTDQEMFQGLSMIARYDLDPIAREIYVTRDKKGRLMTIVAIDGWIKILDRTEGYEGFDQDIELDGERYAAVTTKIYSRVRKHPAVYTARMSEWAKQGGYMWGQIPNHMLQLLSLRHAARLFTPLGGNVVMQEEFDLVQQEDAPSAPPTPKQNGKSKADQIADELEARFNAETEAKATQQPAETAAAESSEPESVPEAELAETFATRIREATTPEAVAKWKQKILAAKAQLTDPEFNRLQALITERIAALRKK